MFILRCEFNHFIDFNEDYQRRVRYSTISYIIKKATDITDFIVNTEGFEPSTVPIKNRDTYPARLLFYSLSNIKKATGISGFVCERRRIRTFDRLLRRQVLYPAELCILFYVGVAGFEPAASCSQSRRDNRATLHPEKPKSGE